MSTVSRAVVEIPNRVREIVEVICSENNVTFDGSTFGPLPVENKQQF